MQKQPESVAHGIADWRGAPNTAFADGRCGRRCQRLLLPDQHEQPLAPRDARIDQIPLQQHVAVCEGLRQESGRRVRCRSRDGGSQHKRVEPHVSFRLEKGGEGRKGKRRPYVEHPWPRGRVIPPDWTTKSNPRSTTPRSEPRIDRLAFQREHSEHALMHPSQRLPLHEPLKDLREWDRREFSFL